MMSRLAIARITCTLLPLLLPACANLDAVREFGKSAAEISTYPKATTVYQQSAITANPYRLNPPTEADKVENRQRQATAVLARQNLLSKYFSTLSKLAGADAFSLDKEIDAIAKSVNSLPPGTLSSVEVAASQNLLKTLSKYALMSAQERAVRDLVREGGAAAMDILGQLRTVLVNWEGIVGNDRKAVINVLTVLPQAKNTSQLDRLIAADRAADLGATYDSYGATIKTVRDALDRIEIAHKEMVAHMDDLTGSELKDRLSQAVSDLKSGRLSLAALS